MPRRLRPLAPALIPALAALLLGCAPTAARADDPPLPAPDRTFAPGQRWEVSWSDGTRDHVTVPPRDDAHSTSVRHVYAGAGTTGSALFYSEPAGDAPFANISVDRGDVQHYCWLRAPGRIDLGERRVGLETPDQGAAGRFVREGTLAADAQACSATHRP